MKHLFSKKKDIEQSNGQSTFTPHKGVAEIQIYGIGTYGWTCCAPSHADPSVVLSNVDSAVAEAMSLPTSGMPDPQNAKSFFDEKSAENRAVTLSERAEAPATLQFLETQRTVRKAKLKRREDRLEQMIGEKREKLKPLEDLKARARAVCIAVTVASGLVDVPLNYAGNAKLLAALTVMMVVIIIGILVFMSDVSMTIAGGLQDEIHGLKVAQNPCIHACIAALPCTRYAASPVLLWEFLTQLCSSQELLKSRLLTAFSAFSCALVRWPRGWLAIVSPETQTVSWWTAQTL